MEKQLPSEPNRKTPLETTALKPFDNCKCVFFFQHFGGLVLLVLVGIRILTVVLPPLFQYFKSQPVCTV